MPYLIGISENVDEEHTSQIAAAALEQLESGFTFQAWHVCIAVLVDQSWFYYEKV